MISDTQSIKRFCLNSLKFKWTQAVAASGILLSTWGISVLFKTLLVSVFKIDLSFSAFDPQNWNRTEPIVVKLLVDMVTFGFSLLLTVPLNLGVLRWFWRTALGADDSVGNVFYYYTNSRLYFRAVAFYLLFILRVLIIGFLAFLPGYVAAVLTDENFYKLIGVQAPEVINTFYALQYCLLIIGAVLFVPLIMRYFPAPVLLFSHEGLSPNRVYKVAARISSGRKVEFASLILSFFGWLVLSLLGVTIVFTLPYFLGTVALYCFFVVNEYNLSEPGD